MKCSPKIFPFSSSSSSSSSSGGDRRKRRQSRSKSRSAARKLDSKEKDGKERPKSRERGHLSAARDGNKRRGSSDRRSKSKDRARRTRDGSHSRSRSTSARRKRESSPAPKPSRIHIGRLTRNVKKEHVIEIFATFGEVRNVEFPTDRFHPQNGRGFCYVEFVNPDDAETAMKHMDGGQIDGQEVTVAPILHMNKTGVRRSPMRRGPQPMRNRGGWGRGGDMRNNRRKMRSPDRRDRRR